MSPDLQEWIGIVLAAAPSGHRQQLEPLLQAIEQTFAQKDKDCGDLRGAVRKLEAELHILREENSLLKHRIFGQSSENSTNGMGSSAPDDEEFDGNDENDDDKGDEKPLIQPSEATKKPRGMRGKQRSPLPEHLLVEDVVMDLANKTCPCGDTLRSIGKPEVIKRLCVRKAVCYIRQEIYLKYKCKCCGQFRQEKTPRRLLENSRYDSSFWTDIIVSKFVDYLPLYRQEERLRRSGVKIPRSTMVRGLQRITELLSPLNDELMKFVLGGGTLDVDETRVPMLKPGNGKRTLHGRGHIAEMTVVGIQVRQLLLYLTSSHPAAAIMQIHFYAATTEPSWSMAIKPIVSWKPQTGQVVQLCARSAIHMHVDIS